MARQFDFTVYKAGDEFTVSVDELTTFVHPFVHMSTKPIVGFAWGIIKDEVYRWFTITAYDRDAELATVRVG